MLLALLLACTDPAADSGLPEGGALPTLDTLDLAVRIAERGVERMPADIQPHDWMQTVWAFSLLRLAQATGDDRWADYGRTWMTQWLPDFEGSEPVMVSSDSTSPAIIAAVLAQAEHQPILDAADAYIVSAPRTDEGAIEHWTEQSSYGEPDQVWIDSMFMLGQYMLERYHQTGDPAWAALFTEQYLLFSQLCRDGGDQLYRHAYDDLTDSNIPTEAVYWNRGNSWVLFAGVEALDVLGEAAPSELQELVSAHAWAVVDAQDGSGLWPTVLASPRGEDPDNYLETSGSALLAAALARGSERGLLDPGLAEYVPPAAHGVLAMIEEGEDGPVVTGTSFGTNPGQYEDYVAVGQVDDLILGVGAVILLLAEVDGWQDTSVDL